MFRLFFSGKACRLLVRQEKRALNIQVSFYGKSPLLSYAKKAAKNPGAARLKNMNSSANNWRICVFLTRHSNGPGTQPAAQKPGLRPVGPGTRLRAQNGEAVAFFERTRNSKNNIRALTRCACAGKRNLE